MDASGQVATYTWSELGTCTIILKMLDGELFIVELTIEIVLSNGGVAWHGNHYGWSYGNHVGWDNSNHDNSIHEHET